MAHPHGCRVSGQEREEMSRGKHEVSAGKHFQWIFAAAAIVLIALLLILLLKACGVTAAQGQNDSANAEIPAAEKSEDSIAIPGYEGLSLIADRKRQEICLPNPEQNSCYFSISLLLEDGTLLWQSELIPPGELSDPIVLTEKLAAGTYPNAVLHYSCFKMDEALSPLNGAEIKVTLRVK